MKSVPPPLIFIGLIVWVVSPIGISAEQDTDDLLAEAQREILQAGGPEAHPYHWAPFVLSGRGAVQRRPEAEKLDSSP